MLISDEDSLSMLIMEKKKNIHKRSLPFEGERGHLLKGDVRLGLHFRRLV